MYLHVTVSFPRRHNFSGEFAQLLTFFEALQGPQTGLLKILDDPQVQSDILQILVLIDNNLPMSVLYCKRQKFVGDSDTFGLARNVPRLMYDFLTVVIRQCDNGCV